jgi:hypothetical protein
MTPLTSRRFGIVLALILVGLSATAPAYAAPAAQATPPSSSGIGNLYVVSGQPMEFDFLYGGGNQPAQLNLGNAAGSVRFDVYTDWQWHDMAAGDRSVVPIGRGTPNPLQPGQLFWEGQSPEAGFYHVQVTPNSTEPSSFWIALSGAGAASALVPVPMTGVKPAQPATGVAAQPVPTVAPTQAATASAQATPAPTAKATAAPTAEATPAPTSEVPAAPTAQTTAAPTEVATLAPAQATAVSAQATAVSAQATAASAQATAAPAQGTAAPAPTAVPTPQPTQGPRTGAGNWQLLGSDPMEYVFRYGGGDAPAHVIVGADPAGAVAFNVYTSQQWTELGNGMYWTVPVGRGTVNANEGGNLFWEARTSPPDTYHVQIFRLGNDPAHYWIDLGGWGAVGGLQPMSPPAK